MGLAENFEKEKLIIGFIYSSEDIYEKALEIMVEKFGNGWYNIRCDSYK
mgnify:CR=1 FL=1